MLVALAASAAAADAPPVASLPPADSRTCPRSHPIKAAVSPLTGECLYHLPGGTHYERTLPEICYATEKDARTEDCRRVEEVM